MDGLNTSPVTKSFEFRPEPAFLMLDEAARRFGQRPAIDFLGKRWNWEAVGALTERAAAGLQKLGVKKGVKVGLCLPNTPYSIIMFHGILKAGGTVVNCNPLYTGREMEKLLGDAGVTHMVSLDLGIIHSKIARLAAKGLFQHVVVCSMLAALPWHKALLFRLFKRQQLAKIKDQPFVVAFDQLINGAAKPRPVEIDPLTDIAVLQFTGGTTGTPKAAMLSHANIAANVQQILASAPMLIPGEERIMALLPFFHVFAMTGVMNLGIALGAELVLLPRMDLKQFMATLFRCRPTILPGVPTLYAAISNAAEKSSAKLDFIKYCVSGGAPIAAETAVRFEQVSRCHLLEGYGLSETSPVVSITPPDAPKTGSVGLALPGTVVEIRDPDRPERILPQGERGEICIRGPQVMLGYYQQPEETELAFIDGAFRTGDIGYVDATGYLYIVDRIKDMIISAGFKVYPRSIEEAAYQHPAVQDAVAIAVPDAYRGQAAKLFVTLLPEAEATAESIRHFLFEYLNKIEVPREVEIRHSLPKTMVGKLSKKELVAEEAAKAKESVSLG